MRRSTNHHSNKPVNNNTHHTNDDASIVEVIDLTAAGPTATYSPNSSSLTRLQHGGEDEERRSLLELSDRLLAEELQRQEQRQQQQQQYAQRHRNSWPYQRHYQRNHLADVLLDDNILANHRQRVGRHRNNRNRHTNSNWPNYYGIPRPIQDDQLSYEELLALSDRIGTVSHGASAEQIARLPTITGRIPAGSDIQSQQCSICLYDYEASEERTLMPACMHQFHRECIVNWLKQSKLCPVCRVNVFDDSALIGFE
jgi:hypothetical protein